MINVVFFTFRLVNHVFELKELRIYLDGLEEYCPEVALDRNLVQAGFVYLKLRFHHLVEQIGFGDDGGVTILNLAPTFPNKLAELCRALVSLLHSLLRLPIL